MRRWLLVIACVAACHETPQQRTEEVCGALCDCLAPTNLACVDQCVTQLNPVSDACFTCTTGFEATCSALETNCLNLCEVTQTAQQVCEAFCTCFDPTNAQCVAQECLPNLTTPVSSACSMCVNTNSGTCSLLESNCDSLCFSTATPILGGTK